MSFAGHSVLQVPVPQLEQWVRGRTAFYDAAYLSPDSDFGHAHVTALGPFLPELDARSEAAVARVVAATSPFDFTLERLETFPNGIIHAVPEPAAPFAALTAALVEAFPECPPYAGEFPEVRPHLTLDARSDVVSEESTRAALAGVLPVRCRATRLDLAWYEPGACRLLRSWRLGSGA